MVAFLVWFVALVPLVICQGQPCNSTDSQGCLQALRSYLRRTDWWFGDSYSSKCPDGVKEETLACMNPDKQHKSIISRILGTDSSDVNNVTQLLHVRYYVPGGSYRACGHIFNVPSMYMDQDLDFSQPTGMDSWSTRNRPAVTWDAEPGVSYTLVAYNVDLLQLAGLWVNIMGGDSALGHELYPYIGPTYALNRTSFHAFLLLKQSSAVSESLFDAVVANIQDVMRNNSGVYRLSSLPSALGQIQNLMGVGLLSVGADPYGIETHKSRNAYNNCPWLLVRMRPLVAAVVAVQGLTLGADVSNLDIEVEVNYRSDAISYTACCRNLSASQRTLNIDPISMSSVNPVYLRSPPFVRFSPINLMDSHFFFGKMFTLVLLDVTASYSNPSLRRTYLQWLVVDIPGQYARAGVTLKNYLVPQPSLTTGVTSLYMFFVFTQNNTLGNTSLSGYYNSNVSGDADFLLEKFSRDNSLRLSGVSWFWSQPDLYSRMKMYESNSGMMDMACGGLSGYGRPCPDPCATSTPAASMTTAAPGNKNNGVISTLLTSDRHLLHILLFFSMAVVKWRWP
ncbi:hypothetical protein BsWGS_07124 [Bradybaena similaris]